MHPAVGYSLPRQIRPGGIMIGNDFIPGGVRRATTHNLRDYSTDLGACTQTYAGVNAWQIHKHPEIFGDRPDEFRPERWLTADKDTLARMDRHMFAVSPLSH